MGTRAGDFGYSPSDMKGEVVRAEILSRIDYIIQKHDEKVNLTWKGQDAVCDAYVKNGFVVLVDKDLNFVSAFKEVQGGNKRLNEARPI